MSDSEPFDYPFFAFGYHPNKPGAIVSGVIFTILSLLLFIPLWRRKTWWGLCLPIGTLSYATGFFLRYASAWKPDSLGLFISGEVLLVTSPAAFLAFNYIAFGRLIRTFATGRNHYSLIRPEITARVFIISDMTTFGVQGFGGSLQAKDNTADAGRIILLVGIVAQYLSYVIFFGLLIHSHRQFNKDDKFDEYNFPWRLFHILHFSSVFIIIRATYRTAEFAEGNDGYLISHEVFFYVLDFIPMFNATAIYTYWWPGKLIQDINAQTRSLSMRSVDGVEP